MIKIKSITESFLYSNPLAYERMSNVLYFITRSYSKEEVIEFINYVFSIYEKEPNKNLSIIELMLFFAEIFTYNREKYFSGFIYKKNMDLMKTRDAISLYAEWCYRFNDYTNSKHFYKKALSFSYLLFFQFDQIEITYAAIKMFLLCPPILGALLAYTYSHSLHTLKFLR